MSMIGKLQYVVHIRPNITLDFGIIARFFANPKENHLIYVKRIMRYLKGIEDYGLYYKKNDKFGLKVYIDDIALEIFLVSQCMPHFF